MGRKNYLVEKLSKEEKSYLKRIIKTARYLYIRKNRKYLDNTYLELKDELFQTEDSLIDCIMERGLFEVRSVEEFINSLSNPVLCKNVKALSLREKEVLFYLFWEKNKVKDVAKIMRIHRTTVERNRDRIIAKMTKKMLKGGHSNV